MDSVKAAESLHGFVVTQRWNNHALFTVAPVGRCGNTAGHRVSVSLSPGCPVLMKRKTSKQTAARIARENRQIPVFSSQLQGVDDTQDLIKVAASSCRVQDGKLELLIRADNEDSCGYASPIMSGA